MATVRARDWASFGFMIRRRVRFRVRAWVRDGFRVRLG